MSTAAEDISYLMNPPDLRKEEVVGLYREAGWWDEAYDDSSIPAMIERSTLFVAAYHGTRLAGMGRAITDGVSEGYIQDIVVADDYRKHGIGGRIVRMIVTELRRRGFDWIALIGAPGTQHFYEGLGFEVMRDHVPMQLKMD